MSGETWSREGMQCPECGHLNEPEESYHYDDSVELWCDSCGVKFHSSCHISHTWTWKVSETDD